MNKNFVMNCYCEIAVAYAVTYVEVHSAPWQCLEILKTNRSARNFLEHTQKFQKTNQRFRNLKKPITAVYDYIWLIMYRNKNTEILQGESSALEIKKTRACYNG